MDFHTLTPKFSAKNKWVINGQVNTRFSSAANEFTNHLHLTYANKKWAFLTSATYSSFGDLRMGSVGNDEYQRFQYIKPIDGVDSIVSNPNPNEQLFTGYTQFNAMQKVVFRAKKDLTFNFTSQIGITSDVPRYDRLIETREGVLRNAEWYYGPQTWWLNSLHVSSTKKTKFYEKAKITAAYQFFEESRNDRRYRRNTIRRRTETVNLMSLNADLEKELGNSSELYYGFEALTNNVSSTAFEANINSGEEEDVATRYPDGSSYTSFSVYGNFKKRFKEKTTFIAGIRLNQVFINADFDTTFYPFPFTNTNIQPFAINGSTGIAHRPNDKWQLNLVFSTGFRAPNIDDVGKVFDSEPGNIVVPNPNLSSEYAYNAEASFTRNFSSRVQITGGLFYRILTNAMVRAQFQYNGQDSLFYDGELSAVEALVNADQLNIYGFQAGFKANITNGLKIKSNITYMQVEDTFGDAVRHAPPVFGATHIIYSYKKFRFTASSLYH